MYCRKCGKELGEQNVFCPACGTRIGVEKAENLEISSDTASDNISQSEDGIEKSNTLKDKKQTASKWMDNIKIIFLLLCIAITVVGIVKGCIMLREKEQEQQRVEREERIQRTLAELGNRSSGSTSFNTSQYSMALLFLSSAALGESNISNYAGMNAEEIKEECFETLESYFERDYLRSYAALLFCADYFEKEDVDYFYDGTKIASYELKECVEELLFENDISLSSLLVNKLDEQICYTMNLRIRLADDGYMAAEDAILGLYQFVFEDKPLQTIDEELLNEGITYEQVVLDLAGSFTGQKLYYEDLSPVGKLVFLYLMPRYVVQFDQEAGSDLWNNYFVWNYERCWEEIINREIFSRILE